MRTVDLIDPAALPRLKLRFYQRYVVRAPLPPPRSGHHRTPPMCHPRRSKSPSRTRRAPPSVTRRRPARSPPHRGPRPGRCRSPLSPPHRAEVRRVALRAWLTACSAGRAEADLVQRRDRLPGGGRSVRAHRARGPLLRQLALHCRHSQLCASPPPSAGAAHAPAAALFNGLSAYAAAQVARPPSRPAHRRLSPALRGVRVLPPAPPLATGCDARSYLHMPLTPPFSHGRLHAELRAP